MLKLYTDKTQVSREIKCFKIDSKRENKSKIISNETELIVDRTMNYHLLLSWLLDMCALLPSSKYYCFSIDSSKCHLRRENNEKLPPSSYL